MPGLGGAPLLSAPADNGGGLAGVFMLKGLKRRYGQGHLHFITCSGYRRLPLPRSVASRNTMKIWGKRVIRIMSKREPSINRRPGALQSSLQSRTHPMREAQVLAHAWLVVLPSIRTCTFPEKVQK
jgi:hypothetical protein